MLKVTLGERSLPALGVGTYALDKSAASADALRFAVDAGLEVIDCATYYHNEDFIGEVLKPVRDRVFLVGKVLPSEASYTGTRRALELSLRRLQTDCLDLYLLHWKGPYPLSETVRALRDLRRAGLIRNWGLSNVDLPELLSQEGAEECAASEILYNLYVRDMEYDYLPWAQNGKAILAYSPLGEGRLLRRPEPWLTGLAERKGVSVAALLTAFVMRSGRVIAIPKMGSVAHVKDCLTALDVTLDEEDVMEIDRHCPPPVRKMPLRPGW
ncbi:MAG TPA: aldo/keto reductase [Candidatus Avisuccinivibrio pullicola]|nr:aldo/keto reductase [Candidatus Avisuccinivibrio pullicola]